MPPRPIEIPGVIIRPGPLPPRVTERVLVPSVPLLLLPLRLEYRLFEPQAAIALASPPEDPASHRGWASAKLRYTQPRYAESQLWVRWFPDDTLIVDAASELSEMESAALTRYRGRVKKATADLAPAPAWFDTDQPELNAAWQEFVGAVGFARALALWRADTGSLKFDRSKDAWILGQPARVQLYALTGGSLSLLGEGEPLPEHLTVSVESLGPGRWLTDFDQAIKDGMGLRLKGAKVDDALKAEWLIAAGIAAQEASRVLGTFFSSKLADGEFDFLPQDGPTNNSSRERSPFSTWISDPVAALHEALALERPAADQLSDADELAAALDVAPAALRGARRGGEREHRQAEAAALALMPGLVASFGDVSAAQGVDLASLTSFLARFAFARGPLPSVRLDHSPYGILPITIGSEVGTPAQATGADAAVFRFVQRLAQASVAALAGYADRLPRVRPGEGNGQVLRSVLQSLPVSSRIDVSGSGTTATFERLACPLVAGTQPTDAPEAYLEALLSQPLAALPDPDRRSAGPPLLYRLLRLALQTLMQSAPAAVASLSARAAASGAVAPTEPGLLRIQQWASAVEELKGVGRPQLEVLLAEVIDLLDHRVDAWHTALATYRLEVQRRGGAHGTRVGWYGMLTGIRRSSTTGASDGYVQAPSLEQATSAGLLRSAALRHASEGSFQINLSSRRARGAARILASIRRGLPLREILGYDAERWLHDQSFDDVLYELRDKYAVTRGSDADATKAPLIDGELVVRSEAKIKQGASARAKQALPGLLATLREEVDSLSDLVLAEGVHQLTLGDPESVGAWINVLNGGTPPSTNEFIAPPRRGQGSSYRIAFLAAVPSRNGSSPRAGAEPVLAELARDVLEGFDRAAVRITISVPEATPPRNERLDAALTDLDLEPIDLLLGGEGEVWARARAHVLREWARRSSWRTSLGSLPARDLATFLQSTRPLAIDWEYKPARAASVRELLNACAQLRGLLGRCTPLRPNTLAASASDDASAVDAAALAKSELAGARALRRRGETLRSRLSKLREAVQTQSGAVIAAGRELRRQDQLVPPPTPSAREQLAAAIDSARGPLEKSLVDLLPYGMPDVSAPLGSEDIVAGADAFEARMRALDAALGKKVKALIDAIAAADRLGPAPSAATLRGAVAVLVDAIKSTCDGDALPVWPPLQMSEATTPTVGAAQTISAAIGDWKLVRSGAAALLAVAPKLAGVSAHKTRARGTTDARRPSVSYVSTYLLRGGTMPQADAAGFVVDEWSDVRPSSVATTGVAVNYDAPQAEAPNVLLLGVAPHDGVQAWTPQLAAQLVGEAVTLLKLRSIPSALSSFAQFGLRALNLVPPKTVGGSSVPRIPVTLRVSANKKALFAWEARTGRPEAGMRTQDLIERDWSRGR